MDLDSGLLRAFLALADDPHFGRAASRLHISQQALSKRLQRLETQVGALLVERTRRHVSLTPAGERLEAPARAAVDAVDAAVASVRPTQRPLRVDVLDAHTWPVSVVRAAAEQGLSVEVVSHQAGRGPVDVLRSGDADVVFGRAGMVDPPWPRDLVRRLVRLEPLLVLVSAGDPWADLAELPVNRLRERPCWFPMTGAPPQWRSYLEQFATEHDVAIDYTGSTLGFSYWVERVARGQAPPTFVGAAMDLPAAMAVSAVPLVDPVPVYPWSAVWSRRLPERLVEQLLAAAEGRPADTSSSWCWMPDRDRSCATRDLL